MKQMIAICGLACNECPAFLATQADDDEKRAETARQWSRQFHADIKPEQINCDGCRSRTGTLFAHCLECEIRLCGLEKEVENCAYCNKFACDKLSDLFKMVPSARERLEHIRAGISNQGA